MTDQKSPRRSVPRIESIRVKNRRALCNLETKPLSPLTAHLGASGSGRSTVFDVFAFLSECLSVGLRKGLGEGRTILIKPFAGHDQCGGADLG